MEELGSTLRSMPNGSQEVSDSNSSSHQFRSKQTRQDNCASKFKGVVSQQNGHWGAQIYANHQRIWLGTFKSEKEAAMAYDSAAIKLRNGDIHRNFPWTNTSLQEPTFQSKFSIEAVLTMIKDGSYWSKFSDYMRARNHEDCSLPTISVNEGILCRQLFQKELTPSDVGKLNRLVIPKKYAVKYFPPISETLEHTDSNGDDIELVFFDRSMRTWRFRYCYWKSSQSYVFTRGWNRFIKEKNLTPKDMVIFSMSEHRNQPDGVQKLLTIDVAYHNGCCGNGVSTGNNDNEVERMDLKSDIEQNVDDYEDENITPVRERKYLGANMITQENKGVRLFGVQIS